MAAAYAGKGEEVGEVVGQRDLLEHLPGQLEPACSVSGVTDVRSDGGQFRGGDGATTDLIARAVPPLHIAANGLAADLLTGESN